MPIFEKRSRLPVTAEEAFEWHRRPGAFERLSPPWERVRLLEHSGITDGARAVIETRVGPCWLRWEALHDGFVEGRQFRDTQVKGPFSRWVHTHSFEPDGEACWLCDRIEYELPMGVMGRAFGGAAVAKKLARMFEYRHRVTLGDLRAHVGTRPMRIAVSGSSGVIGAALVPFLTTGGRTVFRLMRPGTRATSNSIAWDPDAGRIDAVRLEGIDAVVHLGGINLASARWTPRVKAAMLKSRVESTHLLATSIAGLKNKPRVAVFASAAGLYGNRGDELLTEASARGDGFLADFCAAWEAAAQPAIDAGIRVVHARLGVVFTPTGGALAEMLPFFSCGVGGMIGDGTQYWSALSLDDAIGGIEHAIITDPLSGPVNFVSPESTTQRDIARTLGRVIHRPVLMRVPARLARLAFGEIADEVLLSSARAAPVKLLASGYRFRHPTLEATLRHSLGLFVTGDQSLD